MLGLLKSADKRIILINFQGLSIYSLHRNLLVHVAKFSDEDAGYENFRHYLADNPRSPVTLLVDSVAEDFIVATVSHVGPFDRKSFLSRKAELHFRGTEYQSAKVIAREASGRRDDKVLFSAITKNQAVDPWVRVLLQQEIPIKSITTPAYALCKIADEFSLITDDTVLLVNWEESGIRQTLIVDGKMMFSRLTPLPNDRDANLAAAIIESCNQSKEYLERIGLLDYGKSIDVHIISPQLDDDAFSGYADNPNFRVVMHHNSIDLMQIDRFSGPQASITAILLCLDWGVRTGELINIYASSAMTRFFQLIQARKYMATFSLALLLLGALVSAPLTIDGLNRRARVTQLAQDLVPIQAQYDALRAQFPETPIPSEAMELVVRTHDLIRMQVRSPTDIITAVSVVITQHPSIELSRLDWSLTAAVSNQSLTAGILNNQTVVNLELYGRVLDSNSIQDSDIQLRQLIDSLNQIGNVSVSPISMPVESGPFSEVNTVIDDEVLNVDFALNVRLDT